MGIHASYRTAKNARTYSREPGGEADEASRLSCSTSCLFPRAERELSPAVPKVAGSQETLARRREAPQLTWHTRASAVQSSGTASSNFNSGTAPPAPPRTWLPVHQSAPHRHANYTSRSHTPGPSSHDVSPGEPAVLATELGPTVLVLCSVAIPQSVAPAGYSSVAQVDAQAYPGTPRQFSAGMLHTWS